ncbi:UNVERIFIED_CONTAM: CRP-like cAMP-binding protein [Acetivibrio alkalicellulosi]
MYNYIENVFLFNHLDKGELIGVLDKFKYKIVHYKKGQFVYDNLKFNREIGIILRGKAEVTKNLFSGKKVIVNQLKEGDVFGIAAIFQKKDYYISSIYTKDKCSIFFIEESQMLRLFEIDQRILKNYLYYVNERIYFLNNRIECFTHEQAKDRVLYYLQDLKNENSKKEYIILPLSKVELADYLGISRASLYRVLGRLEEENYIRINKKNITLLN